MRRGTTPTHTFTITNAIGAGTIFSARVTYSQGNRLLLKKEGDQLKIDGSKVIAKLSQEETLSFTDQEPGKAQLKILSVDGNVMVSNISTFQVEPCLDNEVLA